MKKVAFVNASLTGGGSERVMTHIANYFCNLGYDVTMILLRNKEKTYSTHENMKIVQLNNSYNKVFLLFKRIFDLRKNIKKANADTVVAFMEDVSFFTIIACLGLKKKVVLSIRNNPNRKDKKLLCFLSRYINLPLANQIVFQTNQAMECYPYRIRKKGVVIPNPIDTSVIPKQTGYIADNRIVAIGRLVPQKGFDLLIDSFKIVHSKSPEIHLEIYGDGLCRNELESKIKYLGLEEFVSLKGYLKNVLIDIQNAKMYVSTSDFEGISNTMLEAMALGVPCICTDCPIGGAAMVIQDHVNGILIPVRNKEALVNAIMEIIDNEELALKLSRNGRKVKEKYSIEIIGEEWRKVI